MRPVRNIIQLFFTDALISKQHFDDKADQYEAHFNHYHSCLNNILFSYLVLIFEF